jgi:hypothetical protein
LVLKTLGTLSAGVAVWLERGAGRMVATATRRTTNREER